MSWPRPRRCRRWYRMRSCRSQPTPSSRQPPQRRRRPSGTGRHRRSSGCRRSSARSPRARACPTCPWAPRRSPTARSECRQPSRFRGRPRASSSASSTGAVSVVGGTSSRALPSKVTRPTWMPLGSLLTNFFAWSSAACSRLGETSVADIDAEVSRVSRIVARSRRVASPSPAGRTRAPGRRAPAERSAAGTWRCHPERLGATESSRSTLVKRSTWVCRRRCTST